MRARRAARGRYAWSAEPVDAGVEAVVRAALDEAASRLRRGVDDLAATAEDDARQFLDDTGLLAVHGRVRRAAILLYGTEASLRAHIANWGVLLRTASTPGSEGNVLMRRDDARRPLVLLLDDLLDRLSVLQRTESIRAGAEQLDLVDYPSDALRELLANAFAHRDWEAAGIVEVVHSPEELSISSPGGLLPTLDASRLPRETAARKSLLTREMARMRLAEQAGMGFDRVYRELARRPRAGPARAPAGTRSCAGARSARSRPSSSCSARGDHIEHRLGRRGDRAHDRPERPHAAADAEVERQRAANGEQVAAGAGGRQRRERAHVRAPARRSRRGATRRR